MELLPRALVREVLAFASAPRLVPEAPDARGGCDFARCAVEPSQAELRRLGSVCRLWRELAAEACAAHERSVLRLDVVAEQEEAQQRRWVEALREGGERVLDLRVTMSRARSALWWDLDPAADGAALASIHWHWVDWAALLELCPNVERLDLAGVPLHHAALGDILDAAAASCPRLRALVLPKREHATSELVDASIDELFRKLYAGMRSWKGMQQLSVPSRSVFDREDASNEFLAAVLKFCPKIEYLDGWKRTYADTRFVVSEENLCVSREVWTAFCRACDHLREFSWVVVPFSDEFFIPFGKSQKPLLTRLQLTYNSKAPFRIRRNEYSSQGLCVLVRGLPALQAVDVVLHRLQPSDALIYPQLDEMIDPDVFNDEFVVTLLNSCPSLHSLSIREVGTCAVSMNAITDRGLHSLASAPNTQLIDLQGTKCTSNGVLAFFRSLAGTKSSSTEINNRSRRHRRTIRLRELGAKFGDVVTGVLQELAVGKEFEKLCLSIDPKKTLFSLSLGSRRGAVMRKQWLNEMRLALDRRSSGCMRFVVFLAGRKNRDVSDPYSKNIVVNRSWVKKEVLRVGKIEFFTDFEALDPQDRKAIGSVETWVVDTES